MEGSRRTVNPITKYIPEADVYNNLRVLTDFAFDPDKPQLAVPRVYSQRDCAVVVKMVERGDAQSDEADINAVRQTALSIFDQCVGLGRPTDVYQGRKVWGGSGGWQVAGVNHNINVTIFSIADYETGALLRTGHGTRCDSRTLSDPAYWKVIGEQASSSGAIEDFLKGLEWGDSSGYQGSTACQTGSIRRNYRLTKANVLTFSLLLGIAQRLLLTIGQISQCVFTSLIQDTCDVSI
ncbi:MAG: hypothetical protein M1836_004769 [Candelina mexicana]|nr:MAG: hypothetical protein M1836_004769 [Candelina mexicana]